ncbi:uncharacterized protein LOC135703383 [Ochlerotatus camptorhynchus]|uniref:uncharacterized protein LOC135703383 n=1 Tax=Ochlerotatus camptorhynchus TaxID=644619 RepID=UPI0031D3EA7F
MGIFHSKIAPIDKSNEQFNNSVDPRSPTININRSPIGAETVPDKPIITKVRDLTADLTEILDNAQTPDRVVSEKLQSVLDPRSPSIFLRTPLVLDVSNASNISLRGSSIEYEEIDSDGELSFKDCSTNISMAPVMDSIAGSGSIFSDTSLNTELKADIDCIIQKLYDTGSKDPRSPSVAILRTPIVLEEIQESTAEEQNEDPIEVEQPLVTQQETKDDVQEEEKTTTNKLTIVIQDENTNTPLVVTPKREKSDLSARKTSGIVGPRTPLGCVTNVQPLASAGGNDMRKTALFGQMKQGATGLGSSAELIPGKKLQTRSKIPTFRMK